MSTEPGFAGQKSFETMGKMLPSAPVHALHRLTIDKVQGAPD
jgi:hypothetical protein